MRVDARRQVAYITDSARGGIIVVDLVRSSARMVLASPAPPVAMAEPRRPLIVEGLTLAGADGRAQPPQIVAQSPLLSWPDGIAFDSDGSMIVAVAQFHRVAALNAGQERGSPPYMVYRISNRGSGGARTPGTCLADPSDRSATSDWKSR